MRGHKDSSEDTEYVSIGLKHVAPEEEVAARFTVHCKQTKIRKSVVHVFRKDGLPFGWTEFLERDDVLENYLDEDGTLIFQVHLQIAVDHTTDVWYPKLDIPNSFLAQLFSSPSDTLTDIAFRVDGRDFEAHLAVLSQRAGAIFEMARDYRKDSGDEEVVPIPGVEGDVFQTILEFIYCVRVPDIDNEDIALKLLLAADRLGCTDLKLFVESTIVDKFLEASNAADWLVTSDSHSCALLKEASLKLHDSDAGTVIKSPGWSKVAESSRLLVEIFKFCKTESPYSTDGKKKLKNVDDVDDLDVTSLRERLLEANVDIDGRREMLVERLKDCVRERLKDRLKELQEKVKF